MGLINGTITYKRFRIEEELPKNFKETIIENIPRYAFREINPKTNPETSIGWVNALEPMDSDLGLEKVLFGKYIILGLRKDRKSIPGALFKAQLNEAIRAQVRERRGKRLSRPEIVSLREILKEKLLSTTSPATSLYEMVWNYETQDVYFSTHSQKACGEFAEIFGETFSLEIIENNIVTRTEAFIEENGLGIELVAIESAHFGT